MRLIQEGYSCDYEMNIFINIFFLRNEEGDIYTYFSHENDVIKVKCSIEFNGNTYNSEYEYSFPNSETDERIIKKIYGVGFRQRLSKIRIKIHIIRSMLIGTKWK